jgi:hypothetical protein
MKSVQNWISYLHENS